MAGLKRILTLHGLLAVALMFWCAGTGCMVVSYARTLDDMDSSSRAAEQSMMGMHDSMDAHACCKAKHKSAKRATAAKRTLGVQFTQFGLPEPISGNAMSCCPLTTGSIVAASRSQTNDNASALLGTGSSSFESDNSYQKPLAIPLRLPNRADSYLLDCAFLI